MANTKTRPLAPVSLRALTQRINRRLAENGTQLVKTRGVHAVQELGEYYIKNPSRNWIVETRLSLGRIEDLARKLGALAKYEELYEEVG